MFLRVYLYPWKSWQTAGCTAVLHSLGTLTFFYFNRWKKTKNMQHTPYVADKAKNIYYFTIYRKWLLISGVEDYHQKLLRCVTLSLI
jgi:hypothetical protein